MLVLRCAPSKVNGMAGKDNTENPLWRQGLKAARFCCSSLFDVTFRHAPSLKGRLLRFFLKTDHLKAYATMKRNGVVKRI
jgi:hypothetical protein